MYKVIIIGAGGVTSYLLPVLHKTFPGTFVHLVDMDMLEERNLDRQQFPETAVGRAKAEVLAEMYPNTTSEVKWFDETYDAKGFDIIISAADNHKARRDVLEVADRYDLEAILGGNEYFDAEAYRYRPEYKDTDRDPRIYYPDILTSNEGSPLRCTGELQEAFPQLALANVTCATHILHLLWNILQSGADDKYTPYQYSTLEYKHAHRV